MTERYDRPSEALKTNWADGGGAYPSTDPGSGKRAIGWQPKDVPVTGPGEEIPAEGHNFLWRLGMEMLTWFRNLLPREWTELSEAINASSARDLLRVVPPGTGIVSRGATVFSTASVATGVLTPKSIATDGLRVYYIAGTGNRYVVAVSPVDGQDGAAGGVPLWEINPHASIDCTALCCDGTYVFFVLSGTVTGLQRVLASTGGNLQTAGAKLGHTKLRANGINVVGVKTGGVVDSWTVSTMADNWTKTPSTLLAAVAIDEDNTYVGGTRNTNDVWAYTNGSGAAVWSVTLDTNAPTVRDIAVDGDFVYVATDRFALAAGGFGTLFCLERVSGTVLWVSDLGTNLHQLAVDDAYILALDNVGDDLYILRKGQYGAAVGGAGVVKLIGNIALGSNDTLAVDGMSVFSNDGATANRLKRISLGGPSKTFMRTNAGDLRARPLFPLAVPVGKRS
jgi:hypothetical protein